MKTTMFLIACLFCSTIRASEIPPSKTSPDGRYQIVVVKDFEIFAGSFGTPEKTLKSTGDPAADTYLAKSPVHGTMATMNVILLLDTVTGETRELFLTEGGKIWSKPYKKL